MNKILRVSCPDEKGLVYKVTKILYEFDLNVVRNDEFVEGQSHRFFMRTVFTGDCDQVALEKELKAALPNDCKIHLVEEKRKRIIVFASKEHQCLSEVLVRCEYEELNAKVVAVVSNHQKLQPLVEKFQVPFHFVDHRNISREEHEAQVLEIVQRYDFDYMILAKYMRILNASFVAQFSNRIINIHHSFLPAFKGANPYRQAFDRGVKIIGATAHFVTAGLDEGPIIAQDVNSVNHQFSAKDMSRAGKDIEKIVLAKALRLVFDDRVFIYNNKTVVF